MRKLTYLFFACSWIAVSTGWAARSESLTEKYPDRLISHGYGIVTSEDLAQDTESRRSTDYDSAKNLLGRYWQCVPTASVKRDYNTAMGEDGMGPAGVETMMCDLEIIVDLPEGRHVYGDRRRHPNSFCREFERSWLRLTRGEKIVCFNGDDPSNENVVERRRRQGAD